MAVTRTSSRSQIRTYQQELNEAGAQPPLVIDGIWGPKTQKAHDNHGESTESPTNADGSDSALMGTAERSDPRFGLAGGAELWKDTSTGKSYIVYMAPGTEEDPVYMRWTVPSDDDVQSFFGPGQPVVYTQEFDGDAAEWDESIDFGSSTDIANVAANPFDSWASTLEVEAASQPWLLDDDYQQLLAMSVIEGRPLSTAEIASTKWHKEHTGAERQWMDTFHGDPATAQQTMDDQRIATLNVLRQAGISDPDERLVNFMADAVTKGTWSQAEFNQQVDVLADPYFEGEPTDEGLRTFINDNSITYGHTSDKENEVRNIVKQWLGTNFGQWDDEMVGEWAGKLRNDPNAAEALVETLKDQRQGLFPDYDREADYNTIAAPWKTTMRNVWGELPDDSDKMLHTIIRMNDAGAAGELLTREGLKRGNDNVVNSVQGAMDNSFGGA